jgi:hypothetical protein
MVRITRQPRGNLHGIRLDGYKPGRTYELDPSVADYLVIEGFAMVEMRRTERRRRTRASEGRRR